MPADLTLGKLLPFKKEGSCRTNGREWPMWCNACTRINFRDASLGIRWMYIQISCCMQEHYCRPCERVRSMVFSPFVAVQALCSCLSPRSKGSGRRLSFLPVGNAVLGGCHHHNTLWPFTDSASKKSLLLWQWGCDLWRTSRSPCALDMGSVVIH